MRVTIKPKIGYKVRHLSQAKIQQGFVDSLGYDHPVALLDGDDCIMIAGLRSPIDYKDECVNGNNEAAKLYEVFKTTKGNTFVYWRDDESDDDYLTLIERAVQK